MENESHNEEPLGECPEVSLEILKRELGRAFMQAGPSALAGMDRMRFCDWERSPDGRKHDKPGDAAFPWDGASDVRPMVSDAAVNEISATLTVAFFRSAIRQKISTKQGAQYAVAVVNHYLNEGAGGDLFSEVSLSANHFTHYGAVILNVSWDRRIALRRVEVQLEAIAQEIAAQKIQDAESFTDYVFKPDFEASAAAQLQEAYRGWVAKFLPSDVMDDVPDLKQAVALKAIRALRARKVADVTFPYVVSNKPTISALKVGEEVWVPDSCTDVSKARYVFERQYLSIAELRAKKFDGWDEKWIAAAETTAGKVQPSGTIQSGAGTVGLRISEAVMEPQIEKDMVEVFTATYAATDEDGVLGVYRVMFSPHIAADSDAKVPEFAKQEMVNGRGLLPYVGGRLEYLSRRFMMTRGIPEMVEGWQQQTKDLDDSIQNSTDIGTIPPINVPRTPLGTNYRFGPAMKNETMAGREPSFLQIPTTGVQVAFQAREAVGVRVAEYLGLFSPKTLPQKTEVMQTVRTMGFLMLWTEALRRLLELCVDHMPDSEFSEITGAPPGWLAQRRGEIGILPVSLGFDVRDLNPELAMEKIKTLSQLVIPADVTGKINRGKFIEAVMRAVDPELARELIMPDGEASEQLFRSVRDEVSQMFLGNQIKAVENDPTAPQKLQFLQQIIQGNPIYLQSLQSGGRFAQLVERYAENLQFSVTQAKNAQIGAIGVDPSPIQAPA